MSKTITLRLSTGALQLGPVPPGTTVALRCGYLGGKESRGPLADAFKIEDSDAKNRAVLARAAHVVEGWDFGEHDRSAFEEFLIALYEEEPGIAVAVLNKLGDDKLFDRPKLLDAEDLGKE